ncbi:MAG TPA: DedA family protein [Candidatus Paceibacterota bacterium]|nr:DedA family protein [Candidatus Paceibacterota bacterium]
MAHLSVFFNPTALIQTVGYVGIAAVIFTESGLLIGIVLPGDSVLFTAGFLASQGLLSIIPLLIISFTMAALGDNVGYWLGKRFGPSVFKRKDSIFLNPGNITRAEAFYEEHGTKTIVLARFIPVIRTLAPLLAGVGSMHWRTFMTYNLLGAFIWGIGVTFTGYWLGAVIPGIDRYIIPIVLLIIFSSVIPPAYNYYRQHRR